MITLERHPKEGTTLLSANPCTIIATTDDDTTYFRAQIIVNYDHLYEESWGRIGNEVRIDLRNFYQNRFPNLPGANTFLHGITRMTIFIVRVQVEIREYSIETGEEIDRLRTPYFYLMKSDKSKEFDDSLPFQLLDLPSRNISVSDKSLVNFLTYYNKPVGTTLFYRFVSIDGTEVNYREYNCTGNGQYLIQMNCDWVNLPYSGYIQFGADGEVFDQITLSRIDNFLHPHLQLYYKNDYGIFMTANLYGAQENSFAHEREEYARNDNSYTTYDVQTERSIKVNTGHLFLEQLPVITAINQSREVLLKLNGIYKKARVISKKNIGEKTGEFMYDETLEFIIEDNLLADNYSKFENL